MSIDFENFSRNGFFILKNQKEVKDILKDILKDIEDFGDSYLDGFSIKDESYLKLTTEQQASFYNGAKYMPSLLKLASSDFIKETAKQLGIKKPGITPTYNIRIDKPKNDFLFEWHQDSVYSLGALNSITFWLPLSKVDNKYGSIEVIPESHKNGLYNLKKISNRCLDRNSYISTRDITIDTNSFQEKNVTGIEGEFGDVVVFDQKLIHRSTKNYSEQTRWSIQIRISDMSEQDFLNDGCPMGLHTNLYFTRYKKMLQVLNNK